MAEKTSLDPMRLGSSSNETCLKLRTESGCQLHEPFHSTSTISRSHLAARWSQDPNPCPRTCHGRYRLRPSATRRKLGCRDLDERPDFAALSYVWGETTATPPHHIEIRDGPGDDRLGSIPLTDNCFHALAELQKGPTRRTLWVDAVCINQADCTEKGHQVRYMGDIYSLAKTTFVWLGPGHTGTNRAMRYLKYLGRSSERLKIGLAMAVTAEQRKEQVAH